MRDIVLKTTVIPALLLLAACDPAYRIARDNHELDALVPFDCIKDAIDKEANVKLATDEIANRPRVCKEGQTAREISYHLEKAMVWITACYDGSRLRSFSQQNSGWLGGVGKVNAPALQTKMREIEAAIERRCGVKNLSTDSKTHCLRANCDGQ